MLQKLRMELAGAPAPTCRLCVAVGALHKVCHRCELHSSMVTGQGKFPDRSTNRERH